MNLKKSDTPGIGKGTWARLHPVTCTIHRVHRNSHEKCTFQEIYHWRLKSVVGIAITSDIQIIQHCLRKAREDLE